jgi:hypothetical protein
MARKSTADVAKDKAAKQKKMVIVLAVVLVLAMAYAINTMSSLKGGAPSSSKPQPVAAGAVATPSPAAPAAVVPATQVAPSLAGTPLASTPTAASTDSSQLIAVVIPTAGAGQLESFSRFESKDPFVAGGSAPSSGGSSGSKGSGSPPAVPPTPPAPPPANAVISVNGTSESVTSGGNFPAANPVASTNGLFQLVSLTAKSATVAVVGGSYASGSQTLTLKVNKPVTLVNTADGTRYTLVLYPQGTVAPAAASSSSGSAAPPASTTPASTTPASTTPASTTPGG